MVVNQNLHALESEKLLILALLECGNELSTLFNLLMQQRQINLLEFSRLLRSVWHE